MWEQELEFPYSPDPIGDPSSLGQHLPWGLRERGAVTNELGTCWFPVHAFLEVTEKALQQYEAETPERGKHEFQEIRRVSLALGHSRTWGIMRSVLGGSPCCCFMPKPLAYSEVSNCTGGSSSLHNPGKQSHHTDFLSNSIWCGFP